MSQATLSERPYVNSNLFSGHYLDERIRDRDEWDCDDEAREAMEELQELYEVEGPLVEGYDEDPLIDNWIDEVLDILGFGTQVETTLPDGGGFVDVLLFEGDEARRDAAAIYLDTEDTTDLFERGAGVVEAKQWDADFTKRFSEQRPYRNASHQIKHYLENTPENIQWGVLTNGRKWRLYGTKNYETQTYYEVDLPELLENGNLDAFKYFYVFFRPDAFRGSEATFLDSVWSESETAAQELGEDLQDNVFTALRVLGRGFMETNDLEIDPDDDEALDELKNQSLVLLYRLMFVLYAESRNLIHPEGRDAVDEYEDNFSLDELRLRVHDKIGGVGEGFDDEYSEHSTTMWRRLEDLFRLIDEGEESLGIPPYNGGLFDRDEHEFLADNEVSNRYVAEVVYRLSTTRNDEGRYVPADYGDLDTRHLGSVYEGLLEHQFEIAPEEYAAVAEDGGQVWKPATEVSVAEAVETVPEGGLYVVNDEGERKATGAYYTPDYVVTYIVEETVGPLVDEIRDDLREQGFGPGTQEYLGPFLQRVTDLKILDPAMGSAHFLTSATGYLAEEVMSEVRDVEEEMGVAWDEQFVRREIAKDCIYGVDVNGMAVELGKLSMWLETLAADRPLAFLDHHLKHGNSLVGSDVTEILSNGEDGADGQLTLQQSFAQVRERTLDHVMDRTQELLEIDNETLDDIKSMEEKYAEIRSDPLYQRLFELANVHTAEEFGVEVSEGAYETMARAIEDKEEWVEVQEETWFREAQQKARAESFFHWELEFPAVFFDVDGEKRADAGFDAVVGNPPWLRFQRIEDSRRAYQRERYDSATSKYDIYGPFIETSLSRIRQDGSLGFIVQNRFLSSGYGESLKEVITQESSLRALLDFEDAPVFGNTTTYPLIIVLEKNERDDFGYVHLQNASETEVQQTLDGEMSYNRIKTDALDSSEAWIFPSAEEQKVIDEIRLSAQTTFGDITEISKSVSTNLKEAFLFDVEEGKNPSIEEELLHPAVDGKDIEKYSDIVTGKYLLFPYEWTENGVSLVDISDYPLAEKHLRSYEEELRNRRYYNKSIEEAGLEWYEYPHVKGNHNQPKILFPDISTEPRCTFDLDGDTLTLTTAYAGVRTRTSLDVRYLCALFNSSPISMIFEQTSPQMSGGYYRYQPQYIGELPVYVPDVNNTEIKVGSGSPIEPEDGYESEESRKYHEIIAAVERAREFRRGKKKLNLSLLDHLGISSEEELDGPTLADAGLTQPPAGVADSPVSETAESEEFHSLRVGRAEVERESPTEVEIRLTARYKPDPDEKGKEAYTETEPLPALQITNLDEAEADLIEAFVPVAVNKAGGFADFREKATQTNSLVDRLRKLTLPRIDDVRDGLESYVETKERADELDGKIERTDALIDEIVYDLYGLTDEEIEIVEEAVKD